MNIVLDEGAIKPTRAYKTDAGYDLYSREDKVVPARGSAIFDTGVHVQLPLLYESVCTVGFLKSKSGLNVNHNITSDGVIDMGYTGSIIVKLYNHGDEDYAIHKGDKISQLVIFSPLTPEIDIVKELYQTDRGENGFGSSGR